MIMASHPQTSVMLKAFRQNHTLRHSREGGNPENLRDLPEPWWIPAFAGMTICEIPFEIIKGLSCFGAGSKRTEGKH
jgi:hypothetical protein